jgi:hypothetical protein
MLLTKSTTAGLAAGLLIAGPAMAATSGAQLRASETPAQIEAFAAMTPKVALSDAVASAESLSPGQLLQIDFAGPRGSMAYDAVLLSGGKLVAETVDPLTGIASPPKAISPVSGTAIQAEQSVADTLGSPATTATHAIDRALQGNRGAAIDAWMTTRNGKPAYAVGVVEADQLHTAYVDLGSGKFAWAPSAASTSAMAMNSATAETSDQPGDREVRALNLLEAQGYHDFASVRSSGPNFDIRASKGGKQMMLQINPDTGKIVNRV